MKKFAQILAVAFIGALMGNISYRYSPMAFAALITFLVLCRLSVSAKRAALTRREHEQATKAAVEDLKALAQK